MDGIFTLCPMYLTLVNFKKPTTSYNKIKYFGETKKNLGNTNKKINLTKYLVKWKGYFLENATWEKKE